jgi:hypothetical protein
MVEPRMANRSIAAELARGKAENIRLPMQIQRNAEKKFCVPMKSAAVYVGSSVPLGSHAIA